VCWPSRGCSRGAEKKFVVVTREMRLAGNLVRVITPIASFVVGGVAALVAIFSLVSGTVSAPSDNPADQPVITYGSNS